ncbi:uncharacterized protein [Montipora capricornis]|uniref:uncharacterized protein n=1 Tax=Montipora capricornis TaxID=246305 RepID=UPI0035F1924D
MSLKGSKVGGADNIVADLIKGKQLRLPIQLAELGLRISRKKKTEVPKDNCRGKEKIKFPHGEEIKEVKDFVHLGAIVNNEGGADKDVINRLGKAKVSFGRLRKIWSSNQYSRKVKIRLYEMLVKPVLLYGCDTWKVNLGDNERLDSFQFKCLKRIYWPYIFSVDELKLCACERISTAVKKRRWK